MDRERTRRAKITDKGQITIPREIRDILRSRHVEFVVEGERIILRPVQSARGTLSRYAVPSSIEHEDQAWPKAVAESHKKEEQNP